MRRCEGCESTGSMALDNLDDMILFIEVAECGGFTPAGARLGVPKSTISQRIAQLEARLGLRLLNRSTRHVSLTSSGQVYIEFCRRVRSEAASAEIAMANLREQPIGSLRITCPEVTASYFMPEFLRGFSEQCPKIEVEIIATNRHLDLIQERIDFTFRVGPVPRLDLIVRKISSIKRVLIAAPAYITTHPVITRPDDLFQHRCLIHDVQTEWEFSQNLARSSLRPPASMTSDSMGFLLQSCMAGVGVALLPAYVCAPYIATGALVPLLTRWQVPSYEMSMIFPNLKNQTKSQLAFRSYVSAYDFSCFSAIR